MFRSIKVLLMHKVLVSLIALLLVSIGAVCQGEGPVKGPSVGLHFLFNDFKTAGKINSTSLSAVFRDKQFGKIKDMIPGFALSYLQGINTHLDFSTSMAASFLDYPMEGKGAFNNQYLLLEADALLHAKMFSDDYYVNPYLSAGIGASKYKGYYGAIIPLGVGLQVRVADDTFVLIDAQYRLKVTDNTNYHFFFGLGVVQSFGQKKITGDIN